MIAGHDPPTATPAAGTAIADDQVREAMARLERLYAFREPDQGWAVLAAHPDLIDLAIDAAVRIPERLPADEPIALEVVRDPEDDDPSELFAILTTRREPAAIRSAIESLDRAWTVGAARPVGLLLNVGVDCA